MKKFGFTLAEVLITMAIIGVIAAVTLPSLNVNVTENAAVTKYKKALATLSNIGTIIAANDRMDYSNIEVGAISDANRGYENGQLRRQLWAALDRYGRIDRSHNGERINGSCNGAIGTIFFKDGTALCYMRREANFILAVVDINGVKPPNREFTCLDVNCNNRRIGDQFPVSLAGEDAYPGVLESFANDTPTYAAAPSGGTNAARWAAFPGMQQSYSN